jgi:hypothetical protein
MGVPLPLFSSQIIQSTRVSSGFAAHFLNVDLQHPLISKSKSEDLVISPRRVTKNFPALSDTIGRSIRQAQIDPQPLAFAPGQVVQLFTKVFYSPFIRPLTIP